MDPSVLQIVDHFLGEKRKGKDFTEIGRELKKLNLKDETVKEILKEIDRQIFLEEAVTVKQKGINESIWIGLVLIVLGVVFTIGSLTGFITGGHAIVLMYGPLIAGIVLVVRGTRKRKNIAGFTKDIRAGYFRKRH